MKGVFLLLLIATLLVFGIAQNVKNSQEKKNQDSIKVTKNVTRIEVTQKKTNETSQNQNSTQNAAAHFGKNKNRGKNAKSSARNINNRGKGGESINSKNENIKNQMKGRSNGKPTTIYNNNNNPTTKHEDFGYSKYKSNELKNIHKLTSTGMPMAVTGFNKFNPRISKSKQYNIHGEFNNNKNADFSEFPDELKYGNKNLKSKKNKGSKQCKDLSCFMLFNVFAKDINYDDLMTSSMINSRQPIKNPSKPSKVIIKNINIGSDSTHDDSNSKLIAELLKKMNTDYTMMPSTNNYEINSRLDMINQQLDQLIRDRANEQEILRLRNSMSSTNYYYPTSTMDPSYFDTTYSSGISDLMMNMQYYGYSTPNSDDEELQQGISLLQTEERLKRLREDEERKNANTWNPQVYSELTMRTRNVDEDYQLKYEDRTTKLPDDFIYKQSTYDMYMTPSLEPFTITMQTNTFHPFELQIKKLEAINSEASPDMRSDVSGLRPMDLMYHSNPGQVGPNIQGFPSKSNNEMVTASSDDMREVVKFLG